MRNFVAPFVIAGFVTLFAFAMGNPAQAAQQCCCRPAIYGSPPSCSMTEVRTGDTCATSFPGGYLSTNPYSSDPTIGCFLPSPQSPSADLAPVYFTPQVSIGQTIFQKNGPIRVDGKLLGQYISALYALLAGIVGILAAVMVMFGGYKWLTAGGNTSRVQDAKDTIYSAIIGVVLTLGSYLLLYVINPQLVQITDLSTLVTAIGRIEQSHVVTVPDDATPEAFINNPSLQTVANTYEDMGCPKNADEARTPINVYLTGYYKPDWGSTGGYASWACNLATQCLCDQKDPNNTLPYCQDKRGHTYSYRPCTQSWLNAHQANDNYCTGTAYDENTPPIGPYGPNNGDNVFVAAAGSGCFGFGTVFRLTVGDGQQERGGAAAIAFQNTTKWKVMDRGARKIIRGRHIDLFFGKGEGNARAAALGVTGTATLQVLTYCPPGSKAMGACVDISH